MINTVAEILTGGQLAKRYGFQSNFQQYRPAPGTVGVLLGNKKGAGALLLIPKPCQKIGPRGGCITSWSKTQVTEQGQPKPNYSETLVLKYPKDHPTADEIKAAIKSATGVEPRYVVDYSVFQKKQETTRPQQATQKQSTKTQQQLQNETSNERRARLRGALMNAIENLDVRKLIIEFSEAPEMFRNTVSVATGASDVEIMGLTTLLDIKSDQSGNEEGFLRVPNTDTLYEAEGGESSVVLPFSKIRPEEIDSLIVMHSHPSTTGLAFSHSDIAVQVEVGAPYSIVTAGKDTVERNLFYMGFNNDYYDDILDIVTEGKTDDQAFYTLRQFIDDAMGEDITDACVNAIPIVQQMVLSASPAFDYHYSLRKRDIAALQALSDEEIKRVSQFVFSGLVFYKTFGNLWAYTKANGTPEERLWWDSFGKKVEDLAFAMGKEV